MNDNVLLTEIEVERRFGLKKRTLQAWRQTGDGPVYAKLGRTVRYPEAEVVRFIDARLRRSTSVSLADVEPVGNA